PVPLPPELPPLPAPLPAVLPIPSPLPSVLPLLPVPLVLPPFPPAPRASPVSALMPPLPPSPVPALRLLLAALAISGSARRLAVAAELTVVGVGCRWAPGCKAPVPLPLDVVSPSGLPGGIDTEG